MLHPAGTLHLESNIQSASPPCQSLQTCDKYKILKDIANKLTQIVERDLPADYDYWLLSEKEPQVLSEVVTCNIPLLHMPNYVQDHGMFCFACC